ncbi:hypothetical protein MVES_000478 [Malassezia vespertilionis]|uniref:SEC7 domain-containing protein n=1 Tax=Malassezia vespertilionis TaxID=2020962 RepID=A0A2N1JGG8_9BASI|nr:hypothetical protein MVES_000478 [Malassezia vespertilionis]
MGRVIIEEVGDSRNLIPSSVVLPHTILERQNPGSLLYFSDSTDILDSGVAEELENLMGYDIFADAMGQRLLSIRGEGVNDDALFVAQFLLNDVMDEHRALRPEPSTRSWEDYPLEASGSHGNSFLNPLENYVHIRHPLGPRMRDTRVTSSPANVKWSYHILPGGYVSEIVVVQNDESVSGEATDDVDDIGEDDYYLDWLGAQLHRCQEGASNWVIDSVRDPSSGEITYTLMESTVETTPKTLPLLEPQSAVSEDPDVTQDWEDASMFMVERDEELERSNKENVLDEGMKEAGLVFKVNSLEHGLDRTIEEVDTPASACESPLAPIETQPLESNAKDMHAINLPIAIAPNEQPATFSRQMYHFSKTSAEHEGRTAALLAMYDSEFLRAALRAYMARFHFAGYPLDMALRQFLALEHLPVESQQVDRVLDSFASRYVACNPDALTHDQAYTLSFSIMLLHTHTFNKNARTTMTKAAFVSLASETGIERIVLECIYDNVTLVEFIYTRTESAALSARKPRSVAVRERTALYKLITTGSILNFRISATFPSVLEQSVTCLSSFECVDILHAACIDASALALYEPVQRTLFSSLFWNSRSFPEHPSYIVRILKSGMVRCRGVNENNEKRGLRSRWRSYAVLLTGSALLWFKDVRMLDRLEAAIVGTDTTKPIPFCPDEITPLRNTLCVSDMSDLSMLRLRSDDYWYLLQPEPSDKELFTWMDGINYIASLSNGGVVWDDAAHISLLSPSFIKGSVLDVLLPGPLAEQEKPVYAASVVEPSQIRSTLAFSFDCIVHTLAQHEARKDELERTFKAESEHLSRLCILVPLMRTTRENVEQSLRQLLRSLRAMQLELAFVICRVTSIAGEKESLQSILRDIYA